MEVTEVVTDSLPTALVVLLTLISPYITALFTKTSMSPKAKQWISVVVAAVIAVVYVLLNGGVDSWEKFFVAAPTIYGLANLLYGLLLKNSVKVVEATQGLKDEPVVVDGPVLGVVVPQDDAAAVIVVEDDSPKHRADG